MNAKHLLMLALASVFCLTSCWDNSGEEYIYTNMYSFGDVRSGQIKIESEGLTLNITEDKSDGKWVDHDHIFFCCDVLRMTAAGVYDIRMNAYEPVVEQAALVKSRTSESVYGSDAVSFYQDWGLDAKNRKLNMSCLTTSRTKSETVHSVNLVYDDIRSHKDTIFFELRHQGQGESYENEAYPADDFQLDTHYITFDFSQCIPADAGTHIIISIEWDWLVNEGGSLGREVEHKQECGVLTLR